MDPALPSATVLSAMRIADPQKWRGYVLAALKKTNGDVRAGAIELGVSERTLHRWVREPSLKEELAALEYPPACIVALKDEA